MLRQLNTQYVIEWRNLVYICQNIKHSKTDGIIFDLDMFNIFFRVNRKRIAQEWHHPTNSNLRNHFSLAFTSMVRLWSISISKLLNWVMCIRFIPCSLSRDQSKIEWFPYWILFRFFTFFVGFDNLEYFCYCRHYFRLLKLSGWLRLWVYSTPSIQVSIR